jgi:hypothetical protein
LALFQNGQPFRISLNLKGFCEVKFVVGPNVCRLFSLSCNVVDTVAADNVKHKKNRTVSCGFLILRVRLLFLNQKLFGDFVVNTEPFIRFSVAVKNAFPRAERLPDAGAFAFVVPDVKGDVIDLLFEL